MENATNDTFNRELHIMQILSAPIELVWDVWTKPEYIANWWGPNGFSNTIKTMEVKEGGEWIFTMHGPDGKDYPNRSVYMDIVYHQKISCQHFNPNFITTVTFKPNENETVLEWRMLFETVELFDTVVKVFKADEGLKQNVEKLDMYLKYMAM